MATIRAAWKRVIQVKQFESETLELATEYEVASPPEGDPVKGSQILARLLAEAGDALVLERLQGRETSGSGQTADPKNQVRRPANRQDTPPNPKVIETIKKDAPVADPEGPDDYLAL